MRQPPDRDHPRNRFRRLLTKPRRRISLFAGLLWGATVFMVLQFFVPLALNSIEVRWKPRELCDPCSTGVPGSWCRFYDPPANRICPGCGVEWAAPYHEILATPWMLLALRALFGR